MATERKLMEVRRGMATPARQSNIEVKLKVKPPEHRWQKWSGKIIYRILDEHDAGGIITAYGTLPMEACLGFMGGPAPYTAWTEERLLRKLEKRVAEIVADTDGYVTIEERIYV